MNPELLARIEADGFALVPSVIGLESVETLRQAIEELVADPAVRFRRGVLVGVRNLLQLSPAVEELARSPEVRALVEPVLGPAARPVRSLLFDKNETANWSVGWHQDLTIAVRERREVTGFGPWSLKAAIHHVQPLVEVLQRMLTVRLHLDDCDEASGPLRVYPGSHAGGKLSGQLVAQYVQQGAAVTCAARAGDALLMRPLLLHASSPRSRPGRRRVIHLEFAAGDLPGGLEWVDA